MMGLFDKFMGMMGGEEYDEEEDIFEGRVADESKEAPLPSNKNNASSRDTGAGAKDTQFDTANSSGLSGMRSRKASSPVVSIHTQKQVRVVVVEPKAFDESQNIAEHLKSHRTVVLNLEKTDHALAQRIIDFVSGTTYALNGNMQKVGKSIFLFVPNNVDISGDLSFRMSENGLIWPPGLTQ
ncbi:MAG: cell division protein SepF [Peptococcaceae bacterium]|nr:cell division protein SepF [Peptococcaceae bacterium]